MPRYEFSEGSSNKFWEIELSGTSFTTTYGRIGTDGQTSERRFDSKEKAKKAYDKLVAEKVKKGYELVDGEGGGDDEDEEEEERPAKKPAAKAAPAKPAAKAPAKKAAAKNEVFEDEGDDEEDEDEDEDVGAKKKKSSKGGSGKRRFEFSEGSSNKFWEIEIDGTSFTTTYGRIGTPGQSSVRYLDSEEKCKKEYDKLVAEKVKKGYEEV